MSYHPYPPRAIGAWDEAITAGAQLVSQVVDISAGGAKKRQKLAATERARAEAEAAAAAAAAEAARHTAEGQRAAAEATASGRTTQALVIGGTVLGIGTLAWLILRKKKPTTGASA